MTTAATRIQITVDCADPERMARFWAAALRYHLAPPPPGHATWNDYYRHLGVPEEELSGGAGTDRILDPSGVGPKIWFQPVPEPKVVKNRVHLDLDASGGRAVPLATRRARVDAEVERLIPLGAVRLRVLAEPGMDHYAVVLADPEGNEFCVH